VADASAPAATEVLRLDGVQVRAGLQEAVALRSGRVEELLDALLVHVLVRETIAAKGRFHHGATNRRRLGDVDLRLLTDRAHLLAKSRVGGHVGIVILKANPTLLDKPLPASIANALLQVSLPHPSGSGVAVAEQRIE
jgi:hypothetical protein